MLWTAATKIARNTQTICDYNSHLWHQCPRCTPQSRGRDRLWLHSLEKKKGFSFIHCDEDRLKDCRNCSHLQTAFSIFVLTFDALVDYKRPANGYHYNHVLLWLILLVNVEIKLTTVYGKWIIYFGPQSGSTNEKSGSSCETSYLLFDGLISFSLDLFAYSWNCSFCWKNSVSHSRSVALLLQERYERWVKNYIQLSKVFNSSYSSTMVYP